MILWDECEVVRCRNVVDRDATLGPEDFEGSLHDEALSVDVVLVHCHASCHNIVGDGYLEESRGARRGGILLVSLEVSVGPPQLSEEPLEGLPPCSIERNSCVFDAHARELGVGLRRQNEVEWLSRSQNSTSLRVTFVVL